MFGKSLVFLLMLYVQNGLSIRCIECNSANNSMCLDPTLYDKETLNHYMRSVECRHGAQGMTSDGNQKLFCRKIVQTSLSIRCIDCNSANNSMCLDPTLYDRETVEHYMGSIECRYGIQALPPDGNYDFFCRKIVQSILHKGSDPEVRVTRGCGWKRDHRDRPCYKADNEDHLETVCQCFTDECNGTDQTRLRFGLLALSFVCLFVQRLW